MTAGKDDNLSEEEIARRRDAVVRRMANTPPQPRTKSPAHQLGRSISCRSMARICED